MEINRRHCFQSGLRTILQILCCDATNSVTFYCMCGRPVSEWLATTLSYSVVSLRPQNLFSFRMTLSLGKRKKLQGTKSGKSDGKPLGCCAWPKTPWQPGPLDMAHCRGVVFRYQKTLLWWNTNICGIREEIHNAPDLPNEGKWTGLSWFLTCHGFFG
jgi:hypothetical protein